MSSGLTPDATQSWKFAMSQSPPSYSPIRRAMIGTQADTFGETQANSPFGGNAPGCAASPAPGSADEGPDSVRRAIFHDEAQDETQAVPVGEPAGGDGDNDMEGSESEEEVAAPPVPVGEPAGGNGDEDMDGSESEEEDAAPPGALARASAPGCQVLSTNVVSESEDEDEGDAYMADASAQAVAKQEPQLETQTQLVPLDSQPPAVLSQKREGEEQDDESEAEEGTSTARLGAVGHPSTQLVPLDTQTSAIVGQNDGDEESEDEEEEAPSAEVGGPNHAPALAQESEALVPISPSRGQEAGLSLPPEASCEWLVQGEVCSLQVRGTDLQLPKAIHDRLYSYQRQGVTWMWNLFVQGFGGILADEMGLGKTVQVASFLASLMIAGKASRILIVTPVTLVEQWRKELRSWAPDGELPVHIFHGDLSTRRKALRGLLARGGIMLTTYDLVRTCSAFLARVGNVSTAKLGTGKKRKRAVRGCRDDDSPSEEEEAAPAEGDAACRPWDVIIVDEGHQIKNPFCENGRALRKMESGSRFLLTGTPLHNKLSDLWALMDFAQPGLLGNHSTFERNFSEQISKGSKRNASKFAVELKDNLARELKRLTAPHFLRRMKTEVGMSPQEPGTGATPAPGQPAELPPKTDVVLWLNLTQAQRELYELMLGSDLIRSASGSSRMGMDALRAINMLQKLSNHPLLCLPMQEFNDWRLAVAPPGSAPPPVRHPSDTSPDAPQPQASQAEASQPEASQDGLGATQDESQPAAECQQVLPRLRALLPGSAQTAALLSCKLRVLGVLLPQLHKRGHRCIIFAHSTRMLDLIQMCVLRVLGLKFLRIDGSIKREDRDMKLSKFQQPDSRYFCLCMSSQVGGVGLTVTGADRVILCDPGWNPAMDSQSIDRVHRIGQDREVVVYRLVCAGAIEDKMFRLQVFKRGIQKTVFEQEQQVRFFTQKELKSLFEPPSEAASTQALMAEQIDNNALEHEGLLRVVAGDVGGTDDPDALPFWQSTDVSGFSDCERLFMFIEQHQEVDAETEERAKDMIENLRGEEYVRDQVLSQSLKRFKDGSKENMPPQEAEMAKVMPLMSHQEAEVAAVMPLQDE